jgi:hypothetical protein
MNTRILYFLCLLCLCGSTSDKQDQSIKLQSRGAHETSYLLWPPVTCIVCQTIYLSPENTAGFIGLVFPYAHADCLISGGHRTRALPALASSLVRSGGVDRESVMAARQ